MIFQTKSLLSKFGIKHLLNCNKSISVSGLMLGTEAPAVFYRGVSQGGRSDGVVVSKFGLPDKLLVLGAFAFGSLAIAWAVYQNVNGIPFSIDFFAVVFIIISIFFLLAFFLSITTKLSYNVNLVNMVVSHSGCDQNAVLMLHPTVISFNRFASNSTFIGISLFLHTEKLSICLASFQTLDETVDWLCDHCPSVEDPHALLACTLHASNDYYKILTGLYRCICLWF